MASKFFDIDSYRGAPAVPGASEPSASEKDRSFQSRYLLAHYEHVNHLERNLGRLPAEEEFFFLQTNNSFNAFTFIPFICKTLKVRRLLASTYSISRKVVEALMELHTRGFISEMTLLISDSMIKRNPMTIDVLLAVAHGTPNLKVLFGWNHSKVCLLETYPVGSGAPCYFVIEGSGNWSENAAVEQYSFANCKGLFDFREELFEPQRARHIAEGGGLKTLNQS